MKGKELDREVHGGEVGHVCRRWGCSGLAFKEGNIFTVNKLGTASVIHCEGTVEDVVVLYGRDEAGVPWATNEAVQFTSVVSSSNLARGELRFIVSNSLEARVSSNRVITMVNCGCSRGLRGVVEIEARVVFVEHCGASAVAVVDMKGRKFGGIHGHASSATDLGKGKDVFD